MKKKIVIISVIIGVLLMGTSINASEELTDIQGHWAEEDIKQLVEDGVINGYPDATFKPNEIVTSAAFAKMLAVVIGYSDHKEHYEVYSNRHWADPYINYLYDMDVILDHTWADSDAIMKSDLDWLKDDPISREMMAIYSATSLGYDAEFYFQTSFEKLSEKTAYDKDQLIKKTIDAGIIVGYPDGSFKPQVGATRAEATVVLSRLKRKIEAMKMIDVKQRPIEDVALEINERFASLNYNSVYGEDSSYGFMVKDGYMLSSIYNPLIADEISGNYKGQDRELTIKAYDVARSLVAYYVSHETREVEEVTFASDQSIKQGDKLYLFGYTNDNQYFQEVIAAENTGYYDQGTYYIKATSKISSDDIDIAVATNTQGDVVGLVTYGRNVIDRDSLHIYSFSRMPEALRDRKSSDSADTLYEETSDYNEKAGYSFSASIYLEDNEGNQIQLEDNKILLPINPDEGWELKATTRIFSGGFYNSNIHSYLVKYLNTDFITVYSEYVTGIEANQYDRVMELNLTKYPLSEMDNGVYAIEFVPLHPEGEPSQRMIFHVDRPMGITGESFANITLKPYDSQYYQETYEMLYKDEFARETQTFVGIEIEGTLKTKIEGNVEIPLRYEIIHPNGYIQTRYDGAEVSGSYVYGRFGFGNSVPGNFSVGHYEVKGYYGDEFLVSTSFDVYSTVSDVVKKVHNPIYMNSQSNEYEYFQLNFYRSMKVKVDLGEITGSTGLDLMGLVRKESESIKVPFEAKSDLYAVVGPDPRYMEVLPGDSNSTVVFDGVNIRIPTRYFVDNRYPVGEKFVVDIYINDVFQETFDMMQALNYVETLPVKEILVKSYDDNWTAEMVLEQDGYIDRIGGFVADGEIDSFTLDDLKNRTFMIIMNIDYGQDHTKSYLLNNLTCQITKKDTNEIVGEKIYKEDMFFYAYEDSAYSGAVFGKEDHHISEAGSYIFSLISNGKVAAEVQFEVMN